MTVVIKDCAALRGRLRFITAVLWFRPGSADGQHANAGTA
jgi:hypothetical protein